MKAYELKKKYLEFFKSMKHKIIASASLIPEHDPTTLFISAGMQPLVPFLLGQPHPDGMRLADVQKCLRTVDIDDVGDATHLTFFEMLGNWSLGDYWKKESIEMSYEFLTDVLGFDKDKILITIFAGDKNAPRDEESSKVWLGLGIKKERIFYLPKDDNWWGPAGETGPCGPCTEIFIDTGKKKCSSECRPGCGCGKYFEIWNNVFMEYNKTKKGYEKLKQRNVDTGMGVERTTAMLNGKGSVYETEFFEKIINEMEKISGKKYKENERAMRIIADHIRAAVFILAEGIAPSNLDRGYILRRFIRRSIRYGRELGLADFTKKIAEKVVETNKDAWPELERKKDFILDEINKEEEKFSKTLANGLRKFDEISRGKKRISGKDAFLLFQSYGFPIEMTVEMAKEHNMKVDVKGFEEEFKKHQETSRIGAEKKFRGGLSDSSDETIKLHTATHLLNQALREVLNDKKIVQKGSNITPERLRFDFNFERKLTDDEIKKVENWVNEKINEHLSVERKEMSVAEAKKSGACGQFESKYGEKVFVYFIGSANREICGGPHVKNTEELGHFKIIKEESVAAGTRRIKAVLE